MTAEEAQHFERFSVWNATQAMAACSAGTCEAYRDIFAFKRWAALGFGVKRGEHGARLTTWVVPKAKEGEYEDEQERRRNLIARTTVVFCRHQVEARS